MISFMSYNYKDVFQLTSVFLALLVICFASPLNFFTLGDWGGTNTYPYFSVGQQLVSEAMNQAAKKMAPNFIISTGDNIYPHGIQSDEHDKRFKMSFENVYGGKKHLQVPWYIIAGNHDHRGNVSAEVAYTQRSKFWQFPSLYYNVIEQLPNTKITIELIFLDTTVLLNTTKESLSQWKWINHTLQESKANWLFVIGHHPLWSAGKHGPIKELIQLRSLLEKHKVAAYICGHDHNWQHIRVNSVDYLIVGTGQTQDPRQLNKKSLPEGSLKFFWPSKRNWFEKAVSHMPFGLFKEGGFLSISILNEKDFVIQCILGNGDKPYSFMNTNPRYFTNCTY